MALFVSTYAYTKKCSFRRMGKCELAVSSFFVLHPTQGIPAGCITKQLTSNPGTYLFHPLGFLDKRRRKAIKIMTQLKKKKNQIA